MRFTLNFNQILMNACVFSVYFHIFLLFCSSLFIQQSENRALRLRDGVTVSQLLGDELSASTSPNNHLGSLASFSSSSLLAASASDSSSPRLSWDYFDEQGYIKRGGLRTGEDPYIRNRFNQQASDSLPSNRDIPDTRNPM